MITQKVLLAEIVGPPQGVTGASNVASVLSVSVILSVCLVRCLSSCLSFYLSDILLTFITTFVLITKLKSLSIFLYLSDILNNFYFDN